MITITFDDGVLNTYEVAFPLMEKYTFKGVVFIPTGILTGTIKTVRLDDEPYMTLEQIKELHRAGWEIGSHSVTHRNFRELSDDNISWELDESKSFLSRQGFDVVSFAYPYGHQQYYPKHICMASQYYKWCRTVTDGWKGNRLLPYPSERLELPGIPMDPPYEFREELCPWWLIFVFHVVKDPSEFEKWLKKLKGEIVRFLDVK